MSTITHIHTQFDYENKLFTADATNLKWAAGVAFDKINLIGSTGVALDFELSKTVTGTEGIVSWDYTPTTASIKKVPDSKGTRIRIFNE